MSAGKVAKKLSSLQDRAGIPPAGLPLGWCTNLGACIRQTTIDQFPPPETREGGVTLSMTQDRREVLIEAREVLIHACSHHDYS